jgi:hypothetical protein
MFCLFDLPEQGANAVKHFAGTMTVIFYPIQSRSYFSVIGGRPSKPSQCGISVRRDGSQGLSYFMGNRSRNRLRVH